MLLNILVDRANTIYNPYENTINRLKAISTEGSSALDDSAEIDSQPWPGFAVIDGGGGKEPDKKPDKDPKKTGAKVVASALTAAQLANMLNVSQKQDNTDQVIAPFDPSHITRVTDTGIGQVVIEYKDGTRRIFDKKDVPGQVLARAPIGADGSDAEGASKSSVVKYGDQYDKIGNKKVLKSNVEYTDSNGYKYVTDNNGCISNVQGNLQLGEGTRNEYAQRTVGGVDRLPADDGGHLIGSQFNGSGQIDNLVPQNSSINRAGGEWYKMEQRWADALKEGSSVKVDITPIYEGNSVRPSAFKVGYWIDGEKISKEIMNP